MQSATHPIKNGYKINSNLKIEILTSIKPKEAAIFEYLIYFLLIWKSQ